MEKMLRNKIIAVLSLSIILPANFNFLPVQSITNPIPYSAGSLAAYATITKPGKQMMESNSKWYCITFGLTPWLFAYSTERGFVLKAVHCVFCAVMV